MKIDILTPDSVVLQELGRRLAMMRKQRGFSQAALAEEAGVGVATLRRIEAGEGSQLESWIKLLRALGQIGAIEGLLPEELRSPRKDALAERGRKRAPRAAAPRWGDELE